MDRQLFREAVFQRDSCKCVFCKAPGADAHHLLERRLWKDGGYHIDNGITVCPGCHIACEQTIFSVEDGREAAGITNILVPEHLYKDVQYDKWGNIVLEDGRRSPGELFWDESVQKVLKEGGVLNLFVPYVKYPRTYHLPWSHPNRDDRVLHSTQSWAGTEVVVTEKMDGECVTLYNDYLHARSIDSVSHPSRSWLKQWWAQRQHDLPPGMRICGEYLYARHSLTYSKLPSFFMGFSVWDWDNCLPWDSTLDWFGLFDIVSVPVMYRGLWSEKIVRSIKFDTESQEGYVVRPSNEFLLREFSTKVGKYVRPNHVQTPERWKTQWQPNTLDDQKILRA